MKKIMLTLCLLLAAVALRAQTVSLDEYGTRVKAGDPVPAFKVTMFDGQQIDIADLKGKVVLVNFWATWCPPCRAELKRVPQEIVKRFEGRDFVLLAIDRAETRDKVAKFRTDNGYSFPMGLDPEGKIFALFAEKAIPRNFLVGPDGLIAEVSIGYEPAEFDALVQKIENLLKQK